MLRVAPDGKAVWLQAAQATLGKAKGKGQKAKVR